MTFAHEAVAALPSGGNADPAAIRAMCERRFAYVLDTTEDSRNFAEGDPVSGVLPQVIFQNNISFLLDPLDSTTPHDGVTCLVTSGGKRYKSGTIAPPYSVLSRSTSAQPGSPSVGDAYIIPTAATGAAWAGQDGKIGIYTARGWQFAISPIGREIYVRDVDAYYHRNASGTWTAGVGSIVLAANSVNLTNVLGAKASFTIKVENQTTNTPPASPSPPAAYIIGPSPTGSWAGNAGKLAICLSGSTFTIITPDAGDTVYDKSLQNAYRYTGTAWISSSGSIIGAKIQKPGGSRATTASGSGAYTPSSSVAPSTEQSDADSVTITYTAKATGNFLQFTYQAVCTFASSDTFTFALMKDSVTAAVDWQIVRLTNSPSTANVILGLTAPDTLSHVWKIKIYRTTLGNGISNVALTTFKVDEYGQ